MNYQEETKLVKTKRCRGKLLIKLIFISFTFMMCSRNAYKTNPRFIGLDKDSYFIYSYFKGYPLGEMFFFKPDGTGEYWNWDTEFLMFNCKINWEVKNDTVYAYGKIGKKTLIDSKLLVLKGEKLKLLRGQNKPLIFKYYEKMPAPLNERLQPYMDPIESDK